MFLNWIISLIGRAKLIKFGTLVVGAHLEGTMSRILFFIQALVFIL